MAFKRLIQSTTLIALSYVCLAASSRVLAQNNGLQYQIPTSEYNALVDLYNSTDGATRWNSKVGWLFPDSLSWDGVTVTGVQYDARGNVSQSGHVTNLNLQSHALRGSIPDSIGNLTSLTGLFLSGNYLSGSIPSTIGNLTNLTVLYLNDSPTGGAGLTGIIPSSIGNLTHLTTLWLQDNKLDVSSGSQNLATINAAIAKGVSVIYTPQYTIIATITFGNLTFTYNGSPQAATATAVPTVQEIDFTYTDSLGNVSTTAPTNPGTYTVVATVNDPNYTGSATATLTIKPAISLIMHRATSVINGTSDVPVDTPLIPTPDGNPIVDPNSLAAQPQVTLGLVADGVTPLILEFDANDGSTSTTNFTITCQVTGGTFSPAQLVSQMWVLSNGAWVRGTTVAVSSIQPGFAYIEGFDASLLGLTGTTQLTVTLSVQPSGTGTSISLQPFAIRPPPIVLVHGYNVDPSGSQSVQLTDGTTYVQQTQGWNPSFLNVLNAKYGADFVYPVTYDNGDKSINTNYDLETLAQYLDQTLSAQFGVEDQVNGPFAGWAFTRYDLVCHSQGGVLARMLCMTSKALPNAQSTPFGTSAFRSPANFYQGRFRRTITLGSPHNGTRLVHYLSQLRTSNNSFLRDNVAEILGDTIQSKFDPFGPQIQSINSPSLVVDPAAKFHMISTRIEGGLVPTTTPPTNISTPASYVSVGLTLTVPTTDYHVGQIVLGGINGAPEYPNPDVLDGNGSDGVVDLNSQQGGAGSFFELFTSHDVAHSDVPFSSTIQLVNGKTIFGVPPLTSDTSDPAIAADVVSLLGTPNSLNQFGPFIQPTLLTTVKQYGPLSQEAAIDAVIPNSPTKGQIKNLTSTSLSSEVHVATVGAPTTYSFQLIPDVSEPIQGTVTWYAETYAPGGVNSNGLTLTVDVSDSTQVTVTVDSSVIGDVVLKAIYGSTAGDLVSPVPIVVVSIPPAATVTGISLSPSPAEFIVGESNALELDKVYSDGTSQPVFLSPTAPAQFTSSDTTLLTVDSYGTMKGVAPGQVTVTASYGGFGTQTTVNVGAAGLGPQISSPATATGHVNQSFSYQITATNSPTNFTATVGTNSLSTIGLSINSATGVISGTPTTAGTYTITTTAGNATLYSDTNTLTLTVTPPSVGFTSWEGLYPQLVSLSATATPKHDGVPNLLKYLYDINPSLPMSSTDRAALPVLGTSTNGTSHYLTLSYRQYARLDSSSVQIAVQTSTDLKTWTTDTTPADQPQATGAVDSTTGDPFMMAQVPITGSRQFIRLQVTMP